MDQAEFYKRLADANDVQLIRDNLAAGRYTMGTDAMAREWLRIQDAAVSEASAIARDAREEAMLLSAKEANDIARSASFAATAAASAASDANSIARRSNRIAIAASVIAAIAAIVAAYAAIKGIK